MTTVRVQASELRGVWGLGEMHLLGKGREEGATFVLTSTLLVLLSGVIFIHDGEDSELFEGPYHWH